METASARLAAPSFGRMCLTCDFTVPSPTERARLICALVSPRHRSLTTSISRGEFGQLQQRLGTVGTPALQAQTPVSYILFDLTHLDGEPTTDLPYTQRRTLLAGLGINHACLLVPPHQLDVAPASLLELAKAHHIEGIVGKRLDSSYRPGRSPAWLKQPLRQRIEVVVGGWTPGQGNRTNTLGALLLGLPGRRTAVDGQGLVFCGAVGTGWTMPTAGRLFRQLAELASDTSPFSEPLPRLYARNARWV